VIGGEPEQDPDDMSSGMAQLQHMREKYDLQDMVALLGKRSQDTLPYYYSASEAVVVPSHYESFGMVALEAMACGIPVVASEVGGLAFLIQDGKTGFTVPVDDPQALADRILKLISDPELREQMSQRAAEYAQDYAWVNIVRRIKDLYQDVLHKQVASTSSIEF